jgi:lysophospholipase L1-like esterase/streptogramin lyase
MPVLWEVSLSALRDWESSTERFYRVGRRGRALLYGSTVLQALGRLGRVGSAAFAGATSLVASGSIAKYGTALFNLATTLAANGRRVLTGQAEFGLSTDFQAVGRVAGDFSPVDLTSKKMWLKANTGVVMTDFKVSQVDNLAQASPDLVQTDASLRPVAGTGVFGHPAIDFSNAKRMTIAALISFEIGWPDYVGPGYQFGVFSGKITGDGSVEYMFGGFGGFGDHTVTGGNKLRQNGTHQATAPLSGWRSNQVLLSTSDFIVGRAVLRNETLNQTKSTFFAYQPKGNHQNILVHANMQIAGTSYIQSPWSSISVGSLYSGSSNAWKLHELGFGIGEHEVNDVDKLHRYLLETYLTEYIGFVAFIGDSLTKGYLEEGSESAQPEADSYPYRTMNNSGAGEPDADFVNMGWSGRTTTQLATDIATCVRYFRPHRTNVAVVWCGVNDLSGSDSGAVIAGRIFGICDTLQSQGYVVVLMTVIPAIMNSDQRARRIAINSSLTAGWEDHADEFIDLCALPQFDAEGDVDNATYYQADSVHLTPAGNQVVADALRPVLVGIVGEHASFDTVATPSISPIEGTYTEDQSVSISCATDDATIRYTVDGSTPSASNGTTYSGPFTASATVLVKAVASKGGHNNSAVAQAVITIDYPDAATPTFSPVAGSYPDTQNVTISTVTSGTTIRYTTDGSTPTTSHGTVYTAPVAVAATSTLKAIAYGSGLDNSAVASAAYTIGDAVFDPWEDNDELGSSYVAALDEYVAARSQTETKATPITGLSGDSNKWRGIVSAANGKLYCVPYSATTVLIIDPAADTAEQTSITGLTGSTKYFGGALAPNGKIYCAPFSAANVLVIDPADNTTATIAVTAGSDKFVGAILAPNGKIYCVPYAANIVLVINPADNTTATIDVTGLGSGSAKWRGGCLGPNGKIYCAPLDADSILVIDPATDTVAEIAVPTLGANAAKWSGAVLAQNGIIYFIPQAAAKVMTLDVAGPTADDTSIAYTATAGAQWIGGALGANGKIYCVPFAETVVLIINPADNTTNKTTITGAPGSNGHVGATVAPNGKIYCAPNSATSVLTILSAADETIDDDFRLSRYANKF